MRQARRACFADRIVLRADQLPRERRDAAFDAGEFFDVAGFLADDVAHAADEVDHLFLAEGARIALGEPAWLGAFEEPGGGPPLGSGRLPHGVQGTDLGGNAGTPQGFVELRVASRLAADREHTARDVAGRVRHGAAGGYKCADFALFFITEYTRPARHGWAPGEGGDRVES